MSVNENAKSSSDSEMVSMVSLAASMTHEFHHHHQIQIQSFADHRPVPCRRSHRRFSRYDYFLIRLLVFTCVSYAEARLSYRLDVSLSVHLSVTCWYFIKTAEDNLDIVMLSSVVTTREPIHSSFVCIKIFAKFRRGHPRGAAKQRWGMIMSQFSTDNLLYLRNG